MIAPAPAPDPGAPTTDNDAAHPVAVRNVVDTAGTDTYTAPGAAPGTGSARAAGPDRETATGPDPGTPSHPLAQDLLLYPDHWQIWPAVAVLRWLYRDVSREARQLVYRSKPGLGFSGSEIEDVALRSDGADLVLTVPGIAACGSALPASDIERIVRDARRGGGIAAWLDGPGDRFMQSLEVAHTRTNAALALAKGGRVEAVRSLASIAGRSATLAARPGGVVFGWAGLDPEGATGLAPLFVGAISASGLKALFEAFTSLAVRVKEFAGAAIDVARPARIGAAVGRVLGTRCTLASAGVEVVIEGGADPQAPMWARDPQRRRSLHRLVEAYVGTGLPEVRIILELDGAVAPHAALDGETAFGAMAMLGHGEGPVQLALGR